jgi:hypothetical protein
MLLDLADPQIQKYYVISHHGDHFTLVLFVVVFAFPCIQGVALLLHVKLAPIHNPLLSVSTGKLPSKGNIKTT